MSLAPNVDVTLGSLRYDSHALSLRVTLALLPGVNSFRAALPAGVKFTAAPGDDSVLVLDGGDGAGDGKQTVLTGKVRSVRRTLDEIQVICADASADLSALRPATTYQNKNAAEVIKALAADAGANVAAMDIQLDFPAYVAHQGRTAAEHVAYLTELGGALAHVSGNGRLEVFPVPSEQAEAALLHGRELVAFEKIDRPPLAVQRFAIGNGTAGSAASPDALKHSLTRLPDDAAAAGPKAVWYPSPVVRTPKTATATAEALNDRAAAFTKEMRATCFLLTGLRPGMVVEIQELPGSLIGSNWLLTRVTHRLVPGSGGETTLEGVLAGASGGSLLGALLGAVGGLL